MPKKLRHLHLVGLGEVERVDEPWREAIASYTAWQRAAGRSPGTLHLRLRYLTRLGDSATKPPFEMALDDLIGFLDRPHWSPETRKSATTSVRSFYKWAMKTERATTDPAYHLPAIHVPTGQPRPAPDGTYTAALEGADSRGRLMLMLAGLQGLRRAEIATLHSRNVVGTSLRITGKGGRVRNVPMAPEVAAALAGQVGWIFPNGTGSHLTPDRVGRLLTKMLGTGSGWTGHTLRHAFASATYAQGGDIISVRDMLGHTNLSTTQRYTAVPEGAKERAVKGAALRFSA